MTLSNKKFGSTIRFRFFLFLLVSATILGCSATKVHYLTEERYKPTKSAEVLTEQTERPHIAIAILEGQSQKYRNGTFLFEKMTVKARRIGAHAVLPIEYFETPDKTLVPTSTTIQPGQPTRTGKVPNLLFRSGPRAWGKAVAIRYLDVSEEPE